MKKRTPNIFERIKIGFPFGIKLFGILFTTEATVLGVIASTGNFIPWVVIYFATSVSIIYSLICTFIASIGTHMPDFFYDDESSDGKCIAELSSRDKLDEACEMTRLHYKNDYVPGDVAEQWRLKNPKAFVDIINENGELVSSFGIISTRKSFFDLFIEGKVADTKLRGEDVQNFRDSKKSTTLYISGVIVRNAGSHLGHKRAKIMTWAMLSYYKKYYGFKIARDMYAVAVNKDSDALLKKCGFKLIMRGNEREDKGNLYKLTLTYESWQILLKRIGDSSEICSMKFN